MSRQNLAGPLVGVAALIGGGVYFARNQSPTTTAAAATQQKTTANMRVGVRPDETTAETESRRRAADAKRDNGLGGVGVGMTNNTGGAELATGARSGTSADRDTPRGPSHKFPSDAGAIGGGHGRSNANARAIETHGPAMSSGSSTVTGALGGGGGSGTSGGSSSSGFGAKLQGFFGTGGGGDGERPRQAPVDTKVASHHTDTPTNRGESRWDKYRNQVTTVSSTES